MGSKGRKVGGMGGGFESKRKKRALVASYGGAWAVRSKYKGGPWAAKTSKRGAWAVWAGK